MESANSRDNLTIYLTIEKGNEMKTILKTLVLSAFLALTATACGTKDSSSAKSTEITENKEENVQDNIESDVAVLAEKFSTEKGAIEGNITLKPLYQVGYCDGSAGCEEICMGSQISCKSRLLR